MNSKIKKVLVGVTAAAVLAGSALTATSASAHPWPNGGNYQHNYSHYNGYNHRYYGHNGWGWGYDNGVGAGIFGFLAGAAVGSALSNSYADDNSCYRYRTYNPRTGMYMSYNGPRHCP